ncbi:contractile injection system tape measure protein [Janthinobacterium sp. 1_2014MBL_MicDiv]|uniref:contractile injection system tape measure protein n=1 Tax=Janthinobacterium sp. 1_2014MBL_MicDiv TaxID=1644131 RepID=UPI0008F4D891|nr:contractile injection system tape measure protein [Janthinobacterium sp. 1_2014MBL_MicDiv]APA68717.1 hypothetical protein YQ44_13910 [Janthinobacterium sp. 1_2014MBL_MicDiv]
MNDTIHPPAAPAGAPPEVSYVNNAGLVLFHPFLEMMLRKINVLMPAEPGAMRVRSEDGARAVHLLQYLIDGRSDRPGSQLVLNKLLCGLDPDFPAPPVHLAAEDMALGDHLLAAVIGNWLNMQKMSSAALRETFLQREGRLEWRDGLCTLTVQRRTVDVLMNQLPWSLAFIGHPWMPQPLHVSW